MLLIALEIIENHHYLLGYLKHAVVLFSIIIKNSKKYLTRFGCIVRMCSSSRVVEKYSKPLKKKVVGV